MFILFTQHKTRQTRKKQENKNKTKKRKEESHQAKVSSSETRKFIWANLKENQDSKKGVNEKKTSERERKGESWGRRKRE